MKKILMLVAAAIAMPMAAQAQTAAPVQQADAAQVPAAAPAAHKKAHKKAKHAHKKAKHAKHR